MKLMLMLFMMIVVVVKMVQEFNAEAKETA